METLNKQTIISNSVTKYINKIFNLTELRKIAPNSNSENYVKILRQRHATPWDKIAQSEEYNVDVKHRDWSPLFRFDATKVVSSIFGSVDSDMQNLYNSFTLARNSLYGVTVNTNNFNNITTERRSTNSYNTPTFASYFRLFLDRLTADFNCETYLFGSNELDWAVSSLASCNPVISRKSKNSDNRAKDLLGWLDKTFCELFTNSTTQRPENRSRPGYRNLLPPAALAFKITGTEPHYTYGLNGSRNNTVPYNSSMRQKDGYYFAIDIGNFDAGYHSDPDDMPEYICDLINTGLFGHVEMSNCTHLKHMNVIILKTTAKFTPSQNGTGSASFGGPYSPACLDNETTNPTALPSLLACKSPTAGIGDTISVNQDSVTIGPLVHVIHPVSFKNFVMVGDSFGTNEDQLFNIDSPVNKQEWLDLKIDGITNISTNLDVQDRNYFTSTIRPYTPYLEPKDSALRKHTDKTIADFKINKNTDRKDGRIHTDNRQHTASTTPGFTEALIDTPLYGWTCTNVNCENLPDSVQPAGALNWISAARPIPGPVALNEVNGMLTSVRTCNDINKERRVKWAWTNAKGLNPETKHTLNIKECFMDYEITYNQSDLGKGKVYVDQDNIAHCPLSGDALMCSTFIVGKDSHRYDTWRSNNLFIHKV